MGVRSSSANKPDIDTLRAKGIEIRIFDPSSQDYSSLGLTDIDVIVSTIFPLSLQEQLPLINAAKEAGVKRFVPCDFGTACPRGVRKLHDMVRLH